ncbi:unnamed protein product (mitochondrion) [Plasmodiophora brassicae]|uniref:Uncharacterized protein n=1 Tax=Plasmodiophora brassicae TaxID=37360 RepID=A0A3P3Y1J5_PLABS|nr:unnamed protein product [Plasmodiophora brassicae]
MLWVPVTQLSRRFVAAELSARYLAVHKHFARSTPMHVCRFVRDWMAAWFGRRRTCRWPRLRSPAEDDLASFTRSVQAGYGLVKSLVDSGQENLIKQYLRSGAFLKEDLGDWVEVACSENDLLVVKALAELYPIPSKHFNQGLVLSAQAGNDQVVEYLLKKTAADPDATFESDDGWTVGDSAALRMAAHNGHGRVVALLLKSDRCHPNALNNEAIRNASANGHVHVVQQLLEDSRVNAADLNSDSLTKAAQGALRCTPLRSACKCNNPNSRLPLVDLLLTHLKSYDVNDLPICEAAACHDHRVLQRLLDFAPVDPPQHLNRALLSSASAGDWSAIKVLLQDKRVADGARRPLALRVACQNGHFRCIRLLAQHESITPELLHDIALSTLQAAHSHRTFAELCWLYSEATGRPRPAINTSVLAARSLKMYWKVFKNMQTQRESAIRTVLLADRALKGIPRDIVDQIVIFACGARLGGLSTSAVHDIRKIRSYRTVAL